MRYLGFIPSGGFTHMLNAFGNSLIYASMTKRLCIPIMCNYELVDNNFSNIFINNSSLITELSSAPPLKDLVGTDFKITNYKDLHLSYNKSIASNLIKGIDLISGELDYLTLPLGAGLLNEKITFTSGMINDHWPFGKFNIDNGLSMVVNSVRLQEDIVKFVIDKHNLLPKNYIAVHFRNTDYKNDINTIINKMISLSESSGIKDVYWATDDINSLEIARSIPGLNVISFALEINVLENGLRNLHQIRGDKLSEFGFTRKDVAKYFFLDLYCLAKSINFIPSEMTSIKKFLNLLRSDSYYLRKFYRCS
jgi:hypothetical protein